VTLFPRGCFQRKVEEELRTISPPMLRLSPVDRKLNGQASKVQIPPTVAFATTTGIRYTHQSGRQDAVRTFSRRRPELERRDAANSLWAFGWRGSIITICNNRFSEQTSAHRLVHRHILLAVCHAGILDGPTRSKTTKDLTRKCSLTYIGNMVMSPDREPDVFGAISHPARRRMLDLLVEADRSVNTLAGQFQMSRPAVSQHLRVLLDAGLVTEQRHGRERRYHLVPERLGPVRDWIAHYERFWDDHLQRLQKQLSKRSKE
jgi:DNA-binding transcriptional ArsR family regulator